MATNLLTTGTTELASSDQTLTVGQTATLIYKGDPGGVIYVDTKDDTGTYRSFHTINMQNTPLVLDGAVTYRVRRLAGASCGVSLG